MSVERLLRISVGSVYGFKEENLVVWKQTKPFSPPVAFPLMGEHLTFKLGLWN